MRAMVLTVPGKPLELRDIEVPEPAAGQVRVQVEACGVCRTDLHIVDGDLTEPKLPLVLGHQIVGRVEALGDGVHGLTAGNRVGVPWLGKTCGSCPYCRREEENLCDEPRFTGYDVDGGFAEYAVAEADYCFPVDESSPPAETAPLLCAGLIGYRSLRMAGDGERLGFYGFGSSAHLLTQVAVYQKRRVYAFTRDGDVEGQAFARKQGAHWAGGSSERPPEALDAAIIFAPVGSLVVEALRSVRKGGRVICAGIHMSDIPSFPYRDLWEERSIASVANLTRRDAEEFLPLAAEIPIRCEVTTFELGAASEALAAIREGDLTGSAVLTIGEPQ